MTAAVSPMSQAPIWSLVSEQYTQDVAPSFEAFARAALALAGVSSASNVVDVASGPGTLALPAARLGARVSALDFSPEMIAILERQARSEGLDALDAAVGDGMALPYRDAQFDAGISLFGLMFFPDRARGFAELHRVLKPGATAVVSSWVEASRVPELAALISSMSELAPPPSPGAKPPAPPPLSDPASCVAEMSAAGFRDVRVEEQESVVDYHSVENWLELSERSTAFVVLMRRAMGDAWADYRARLTERLREKLGAGPVRLRMLANFSIGTR
jgi:SAM-dependent methyltransferase